MATYASAKNALLAENKLLTSSFTKGLFGESLSMLQKKSKRFDKGDGWNQFIKTVSCGLFCAVFAGWLNTFESRKT